MKKRLPHLLFGCTLGLMTIQTAIGAELSIREAQLSLQELGYSPGPVDGLWGKTTEAATRSFQKDNQLPESGRLDQETMDRLVSEATPQDTETEDSDARFPDFEEPPMHWQYEAFLNEHPDTRHRNAIEDKLSGFQRLSIESDEFLSSEALVERFNWNEDLGGHPWGEGGAIEFIEDVRTLSGKWCVGNLQFDGSVTLQKNGIWIREGTTMIYPLAMNH